MIIGVHSILLEGIRFRGYYTDNKSVVFNCQGWIHQHRCPTPPPPPYIIYIPTQKSNKRPFLVKLEWNKPHLTKFIITDAKSFMV